MDSPGFCSKDGIWFYVGAVGAGQAARQETNESKS